MTRERRSEETEKRQAIERRRGLAEFYERYETFVETLCDAANYGPTGKLSAAYVVGRSQMIAEYAALHPFLGGYVYGRKFEKLWQAESLDDALVADDGSLIPTICETRNALNMYAEHLRLLSGETT